jgi:hypothetical protein
LAANVKIDVALKAVFNEPVDPASLTDRSFMVYRGSQLVKGAIICSGATAIFKPLTVLAYAATYTATITAGVKDLAGNPTPADYVWNFTTQAQPDTVPPTVLSSTPTASALGVAVDSTISLTFDQPLDPASFTAQAFSLRQGSVLVPGAAACQGDRVTFQPSAPLAYSTLYQATLAAGLKDLAGNPMEKDFSWTFTTIAQPDLTPPAVVSVYPLRDAQEVPVSAILKITFSEPILASSLAASTFTLSGGVSGALTCAENVLTFTPAAPLNRSTQYTATLKQTVSDLAGHTLAADYTWSFTTLAASGSGSSSTKPVNTPRSVTITDSDLPEPPVSGMTFHFMAPAASEFGPGKLRVNYSGLKWTLWFGVTNGQMWLYNLPVKESLPEYIQEFYDYLGIDDYVVYTDDGKCWLTGLPPWLDITKYDPDVVTMPVLISVSSSDGRAVITYKLK